MILNFHFLEISSRCGNISWIFPLSLEIQLVCIYWFWQNCGDDYAQFLCLHPRKSSFYKHGNQRPPWCLVPSTKRSFAILYLLKTIYTVFMWFIHLYLLVYVDTLRPRQKGHHFADDTFKCISLNENIRISIKISLKFVPKRSIKNIPALI